MKEEGIRNPVLIVPYPYSSNFDDFIQDKKKLNEKTHSHREDSCQIEWKWVDSRGVRR